MRYGAPLIAGALVYGNDDLGVLGAVIRATTGTGTNGPGLLYNDWDSSADDGKRFRAEILSGAPAGAVFYENGSFMIPAGTASGTYTVTYRLYVDGADLGTSTVTITISGGVVTFSVSPASVDNVVSIGVPTISFSLPATFAITPAGIGSAVSIGVPTVAFEGAVITPPPPPPAPPPAPVSVAVAARVALTASGQLVVLVP